MWLPTGVCNSRKDHRHTFFQRQQRTLRPTTGKISLTLNSSKMEEAALRGRPRPGESAERLRIVHTHGATSFSPELDQLGTRRRSGRRMRQERGVHRQPGKREINVAWQQDNPSRRADQIGLGCHRLLVAFFLRMPGCGDVFAKVARMVAIEGLRYGLCQGNTLRVLHNHRSPGDGLQDSPMRADRQAQCQGHNRARNA
jgi:hypothetical protein